MAEQKDNPEARDKKKQKELRDLKAKKDVNGGCVTMGTATSDLRLVKSIL